MDCGNDVMDCGNDVMGAGIWPFVSGARLSLLGWAPNTQNRWDTVSLTL